MVAANQSRIEAMSELGSQPRRMLLVAHGYPPAQMSGAEAQLRRKARWWAARGHDLRIVAADPRPARRLPFGRVTVDEEILDDIPVVRVSLAVPDASRSVVETYDHPLLRDALSAEIDRFQPDLVYQVSGYLFGVVPLELARRHAIPSVLFATDFWHRCQRITMLRPDHTCCAGPRSPADCAACRMSDQIPEWAGGRWGKRVAWRVLAGIGDAGHSGALGRALDVDAFAARHAAISDALAGVMLAVANSAFLAEQLLRLGVPPEHLLVARQGVDPAELAPAPRPAASDGRLRVLYLGQVSRHKGVDLLVTAVRQLRREGVAVTARVAGPLTDNEAFANWLTRTADQDVRVEPPQPRAALAGMLSAADVLVVPSRWHENSPNVILEAFAAGVPVIAAGHGGMAEMVRDEVDGLLFAPGDWRSLTAALRRVAREPGTLARLRRGVVAPFNVEHEMQVEEAAIERLLPVSSRA